MWWNPTWKVEFRVPIAARRVRPIWSRDFSIWNVGVFIHGQGYLRCVNGFQGCGIWGDSNRRHLVGQGFEDFVWSTLTAGCDREGSWMLRLQWMQAHAIWSLVEQGFEYYFSKWTTSHIIKTPLLSASSSSYSCDLQLSVALLSPYLNTVQLLSFPTLHFF